MRNCRRLWSSYRVPPMGSIELERAVVIFLSARAGGDGFGDNADVVDAGLAKCVDDRGEAAEGNRLIAAEEHAFLLILQLIADSGTELVNIDGFVAEVNALRLVNGDDKALLVDFLHRACFRDVDFDAGLQNGRGDHEDDE